MKHDQFSRLMKASFKLPIYERLNIGQNQIELTRQLLLLLLCWYFFANGWECYFLAKGHATSGFRLQYSCTAVSYVPILYCSHVGFLVNCV